VEISDGCHINIPEICHIVRNIYKELVGKNVFDNETEVDKNENIVITKERIKVIQLRLRMLKKT
jgi:hypothetical protein